MKEIKNKIINKGHPEKPLLRSSNFLGRCFFDTTAQKRKTLNNNTSGWSSFLGAKAFTLIELLVVVLIIGILSAVALPQYRKAVMKTRFATMKNIAHALVNAQEVYYLANNEYATSMADLGLCEPDPENENKCSYNWGDCSLHPGTYNSVVCYNDMIDMGYQIYYQHSNVLQGKRYCYNQTDLSGIQQQVCKSETGKNAYLSSSPGFWQY